MRFAVVTAAAPDLGPGERLVVEARVVEAAPIPTPQSILPYRRALLVNEYEVAQMLEGTYEETEILVERWVKRREDFACAGVKKG